jgi:DNA-binding transcriptional ArsR family regulator
VEASQVHNCFRIEDLETLKIIADPLRYQIFETLVLQPLTVRQVADKLGLSPNRLYYHVNLLEEHGLIRVDQERVVANIIERVYAAAASCLDIDRSLLSFRTEEGKNNIHAMIASTIDVTREDLFRSLDARAVELAQGAREQVRSMMLTRVLSRIDEARAQEFVTRLTELLQEFEAADDGDSSGEEGLQAYALMVAFYPRFHYPEIAAGAASPAA